MSKILSRKAFPRIALVGCGGVGKTSLIRTFIGKDPASRLTVGVDLYICGDERKVLLVDVGGEDRFRFILPIAVRLARTIAYVFDLSRIKTLFALIEMDEIVEKHCKKPILKFLIGNKLDLVSEIDVDLIDCFAEKLGVKKVYLVTVFDKERVRKMFQDIFSMTFDFVDSQK